MAFVLFDLQDSTFYYGDWLPEENDCWGPKEEKAKLYPSEEETDADFKEIDVDGILPNRIYPRWTDRRFVRGWRKANMTAAEKTQQINDEEEEHQAERMKWLMNTHPSRRAGLVGSETGRAYSSKPSLQHYVPRDAQATRAIYDKMKKLADDRQIKFISQHIHDEVTVEASSKGALDDFGDLLMKLQPVDYAGIETRMLATILKQRDTKGEQHVRQEGRFIHGFDGLYGGDSSRTELPSDAGGSQGGGPGDGRPRGGGG